MYPREKPSAPGSITSWTWNCKFLLPDRGARRGRSERPGERREFFGEVRPALLALHPRYLFDAHRYHPRIEILPDTVGEVLRGRTVHDQSGPPAAHVLRQSAHVGGDDGKVEMVRDGGDAALRRRAVGQHTHVGSREEIGHARIRDIIVENENRFFHRALPDDRVV